MGADWLALRRFLEEFDRPRIDLSWAELEAVVGTMPRSSTDHGAWWTGDRSSSTLRRTLGAILDEAHARNLDRSELSDWMTAHLSVIPVVVADGDVIGDLESQVVRRLDPPLNLDHTNPTPSRVRLRQLRVAAAGRE